MDEVRIKDVQEREDRENEDGIVIDLEYSERPADPGPYKVPLRSLEELKASSPSRKHGVSEEQEETWRRNCVDLIIKTGLKLQIDHLATLTALEFLHRFYAEYSMATNDRFLMSMACLYLAGKVADSPKSSRDILLAGLSVLHTKRQVMDAHDKRWLDSARKQLARAERALLYQTGFRFRNTSATGLVVPMLRDERLYGFLKSTLKDDEKVSNFSQLCIHFSNQSAKIPLILQYEPSVIAAACIWMVMKILKVPDAILRVPEPWYIQYGARNGDLQDIANQLTNDLLRDAARIQEKRTN
jgi:cyclin T